MRDYIISTDSTADLPADFIRENNITIHPLYYTVEGVQYGGQNDMDMSEFYKLMREGVMPQTSASNPDVILNTFNKNLEDGYDVLHLSFSSGLSSSHNNAVVMARDAEEEHPGSRIVVIDTLCASMGLGLLVYYAVMMKKEGKSLDEVAEWVEANKLHICHEFTVEDLKYLFKGGRISRAAAYIGTLINVKPVLHMDDEGKLVALSTVRGRKKSLAGLVDNMAERIGNYKNDIVFISQADSPEDAQLVADLVKERFGIESFVISAITPTIGSHSGPGTIALFHLGEHR